MLGIDGVVGWGVFKAGVFHFSNGLGSISLLGGSSIHDGLGEHYDGMYESIFGDLYKRSTATLIGIVRGLLPSQATVLDAGAGTGRVSIPLAKGGHRVVASEPSLSMASALLDKAIQAGSGPVQTHLGKMEILPEDDLEFDLFLLAFGVVNYEVDDQVLEQALRAYRDRARPGAKLVIQPTPRQYISSADLKDGDYHLNVMVESEKNGVFFFRHVLKHAGKVVADEPLQFRHREEPELLALAKRCGWELASRDTDGTYPVLVFSV
jgi:ubiquinone/menaquinone biosynthesis C-methylase UbiE